MENIDAIFNTRMFYDRDIDNYWFANEPRARSNLK